MSSSRDYLEYILDNLTELDNITYKAMMGEFIIYYDGVVVGGIYDNRLLVKITKSLDDLIPDFPKELPYKGAKEMALIEETDNRYLLRDVILAVYNDLTKK